MKIFIRICILFTLIFPSIPVEAQPNTKKYSLKKGQIFDVLLRSNNAEASQKTKDQFDQQIIPRVLKHGYQIMPHGLYFQKIAIQGNYSPEHMVLGGWKNLENRENAMRILIKEVPNFHQIRRALWTTLFSTYFEIEEDINFSIKQGKFYVVTAYKHDKKRLFKKFMKIWEGNVLESNGNIVLKLRNGKSPFIGHYYEPNHFSITEWDSQDEFEVFLIKNKKMNHNSVKYVNQFVLQPKF